MRSWLEIAPGVRRLALQPLDAVNVYMLGDLLVDAGGRALERRLLHALMAPGLPRPAAHAVTHAHFDHQGGSHAVCQRFGIPLCCGDGDRQALETGDVSGILPSGPAWVGALERWLMGPPHPVWRTLREGDEVAAGFTVLQTPGHTPGSISFWRASDRVLVLGDVAMGRHPVTLRAGLREPLRLGTLDAAANRAALRRLAALEPRVVCFGHGAPCLDSARFKDFVAGLALVRE